MVSVGIAVSLGAAFGATVFQATGGSGIKGVIYGALAGGSILGLAEEGRLIPGLVSGLFQGLSVAAIDTFVAESLGQPPPSQGELIQDFFTGFSLGTFAALIEAKEYAAIQTSAFVSLTSAVSEVLDRYFSGKDFSRDFLVTTIATAAVEGLVTYLFLNNSDFVFVLGNGKVRIVQQAIRVDKNKVIGAMINTEKSLLTWSYNAIIKVFAGISQNGLAPPRNE